MNLQPLLERVCAGAERNAVLERLFFTSIEFAALALAIGLLILVLRPRQPRLRAMRS